jgi:hypothetical protein
MLKKHRDVYESKKTGKWGKEKTDAEINSA